jgi:hypothetical protein
MRRIASIEVMDLARSGTDDDGLRRVGQEPIEKSASEAAAHPVRCHERTGA